MYDCIIIGAGLAGVTLGHFLEKNKKTFCIISDHSQPTSRIAGGVYNPVVLKRFTSLEVFIRKQKKQLAYRSEKHCLYGANLLR